MNAHEYVLTRKLARMTKVVKISSFIFSQAVNAIGGGGAVKIVAMHIIRFLDASLVQSVLNCASVLAVYTRTTVMIAAGCRCDGT
jgi:hypothetical protein